MTLLTIDTDKKSNEINNLVKKTFNKSIKLWMGGIMSRYPQKQYIWLSNGEKFDYTNWESTNPNFLNDEQFCVEFGYDKNMGWNDLGCDYKRGFVCESDSQKSKFEKLLQQEKILNKNIEDMGKREKLLQQQLEVLKKTLKLLEEKQNLKTDLKDKNELAEKHVDIQRKDQLNDKKNSLYNIVHFHQDRYITNEIYQN